MMKLNNTLWIRMHQTVFFNQSRKIINKIQQHTDIRHILSHPKPGSLVIFDIDDTIGRVPQTIGLDAWFRFRIEQYANEGHNEAQALALTIEIYNKAQCSSTEMIAVDKDINISTLINALKTQNIKVIALTARNYELADKTLSFLNTLNVNLNDDVVHSGSFVLNGRQIEIKNGAIFANGTNKGHCLEYLAQNNYFMRDLSSYSQLTFIDDSEKNCADVAKGFLAMGMLDYSVWYYDYAKKHLPFALRDQKLAQIQEQHLMTNNVLLSDMQAEELIEEANSVTI